MAKASRVWIRSQYFYCIHVLGIYSIHSIYSQTMLWYIAYKRNNKKQIDFMHENAFLKVMTVSVAWWTQNILNNLKKGFISVIVKKSWNLSSITSLILLLLLLLLLPIIITIIHFLCLYFCMNINTKPNL